MVAGRRGRNQSPQPRQRPRLDTADGHVDIFDIVLIGKNFGLTGPVEQDCP